MRSFSEDKKACLEKLGGPDRSKKGSVDKAAWPFIKLLNSLDDYYTTSSCAGRITLFSESSTGKKHLSEWLFVSHEEADPKSLKAALNTLPDTTVWLRMEAPIFHVACAHDAAAKRLLKVCQSNGWKRSGIISAQSKRDRIMVEIMGNERLDTPIAADGHLLLGFSFLDFLIKKSNEKLVTTRQRLDDLRRACKKELT